MHCIGAGDAELNYLATTLKKLNFSVTTSDIMWPVYTENPLNESVRPMELGWFPNRISPQLDFVVISHAVSADNPEYQQAQELGIRIVSVCEFLHEFARHKTRVFVGGKSDSKIIAKMILHVLDYWEKEADYWLESEMGESDRPGYLTLENDFLILHAHEHYLVFTHENFPAKFHYQPNIAVLSGCIENSSEADLTPGFLQTLIPGGSITFNAEDTALQNLVNELQTPVRKFPYHAPTVKSSGSAVLIETSEGFLPLRISGSSNLQNLEGARWICQQLGVFATEFHEAIAGFDS